ncbi:hypothetical protein [Actinomadura flavalba]|uniref:hypothetical protein n=1 Tax=Actinomadura flavalba TaxID=1120938 RepID=UPI0003660F86|nr:hypothetical protein [Actinomadura flavalba]
MIKVGYAVGAAAILYGLLGIVRESEPLGWLVWFAGMVIAHDLVALPLALAAGTLLSRWPWLRATAAACLVVTLIALPMVLRLGERPDNPSILPQDYGRNLVVVLAVMIVTASLVRMRRAR